MQDTSGACGALEACCEVASAPATGCWMLCYLEDFASGHLASSDICFRNLFQLPFRFASILLRRVKIPSTVAL